MTDTTYSYTTSSAATVHISMSMSFIDERFKEMMYFLRESKLYEDPEKFVEKLRWKIRYFEKYPTHRELKVRRDTMGKSGRWS